MNVIRRWRNLWILFCASAASSSKYKKVKLVWGNFYVGEKKWIYEYAYGTNDEDAPFSFPTGTISTILSLLPFLCVNDKKMPGSLEKKRKLYSSLLHSFIFIPLFPSLSLSLHGTMYFLFYFNWKTPIQANWRSHILSPSPLFLTFSVIFFFSHICHPLFSAIAATDYASRCRPSNHQTPSLHPQTRKKKFISHFFFVCECVAAVWR